MQQTLVMDKSGVLASDRLSDSFLRMKGLWLVFTLGVPQEGRVPDRWFSSDKAQHFFTSAFVQSMGYGLLRTSGASHGVALGGASAASLTAGVGKELRDRRSRGEFSVKDLAWDIAGAAAATSLLVRTKR